MWSRWHRQRIGRAVSIVGAAKRLALDAALPERCFSCGAVVDNAGALCVDCWPKFTFIRSLMCALCGYPFPHAMSPGAICSACMKRRPAFDAARAALYYDDASREIILRFKHADRTRYANAFGAWISRAGAELVPLVDVVAPVPLSALLDWAAIQSVASLGAGAGAHRTSSRHTRCLAPEPKYAKSGQPLS